MKDKKSWWSRGSGTPMMLLVCMCVIVIIGSIVAMVVWMQAHGVQVGPLHQKATEMTDYAFDLSMRHTSAEDGAVDETKLTGTVLNSAKQAEVTIGEEQPFRIVLDTDYLYLPTKDLLTTFGTTLLGDMDSNEYTESLYNSQLQRANKVVYVDWEPAYQLRGVWEDIYSPAKMQKRNQYMVDHCDVLIALYNGDPKGGTANCVHYAEQVGKRIVMVSPNEV